LSPDSFVKPRKEFQLAVEEYEPIVAAVGAAKLFPKVVE
jgi:hypothetical protein